MREIIDNINILSSFMSYEDVEMEIAFAEEEGIKPPVELDYGTPYDREER